MSTEDAVAWGRCLGVMWSIKMLIEDMLSFIIDIAAYICPTSSVFGPNTRL